MDMKPCFEFKYMDYFDPFWGIMGSTVSIIFVFLGGVYPFLFSHVLFCSFAFVSLLNFIMLYAEIVMFNVSLSSELGMLFTLTVLTSAPMTKYSRHPFHYPLM